jgi:hypothetical protein
MQAETKRLTRNIRVEAWDLRLSQEEIYNIRCAKKNFNFLIKKDTLRPENIACCCGTIALLGNNMEV